MPADLIDFGIERSRHEHFFGREDVLAAIDRHLEGAGASGRWVLVTGGPGIGKSAILSRWLDLEEQRGRRAPHHFLRRDVMDWDRPETVARSLSAQACRAFWGDQAPRFTPRLDSRLVEEAIARAEGNLLYAVKLREWLEEQPVEQRRVERLPRGLSGFLEQIWQQLRGLPREQLGLVTNGLGLVCAAREALPFEEIDAAGGWRGMEAGEDFLGAARALLLEEPASWRGARAYRPYHEAFRAFVTEKLGPKRMAELHRRLLETMARWPAAEGESDFRRRYGARHAITHALAAGEREKTRGLCRDLGLLEALCREDGPAALEDALRLGAKELGDGEIHLLHRAVRAESHWLREEPGALPELVYNRLRSAGWGAERIARTLQFARGLPKVRLRHPVRLWTGEERTLYGHTGGVNTCAISPDGQRIVSASADGTLKIWDLATGKLLSTLEGHSGGVTACALSPDGQCIVSASGDTTLKVWNSSTGKCLGTVRGVGLFLSVAVSQQLLCAGDANGNLWHLYFTTSELQEKRLLTKRPIRLFFGYSHRDEALRDELETHLALLKREGLLQSWHDRRIDAGEERAGQIDRNLDEADVILLLVSADFLASDYCFDKEMKRALDRHDAGQARVIPIILRKTDWQSAPFARLQALPKGARPVTLWQDRDEAWTDVAIGIRCAIEALRARSG
ncbi:TIR domain-containing protein [Sorangium cellulosum]|uniref:TIR domain-containing protein n=1 Tax=Sorangium cellulosum TaxID=56 RepID=UPI003D9A166F